MSAYGRLLTKLTDPEHFPALTQFIASGVFEQFDPPHQEYLFGLERILDGIGDLVAARSAAPPDVPSPPMPPDPPPRPPHRAGRATVPDRTVAFVINGVLVPDHRRLSRSCRAAAEARGWAPLFLPTTREDHGEGLARHAAAAGAQLVFAVGGDGTVRACASALAGTGVRLAIIPRGTANLAARALGIPHQLGAALAVGFGGHETALDLGQADGTDFTAMAGIGLDAAVVSATRRLRKVRLGWLAYAKAGLGHLHGAPHHFTVRLDGGQTLHRRARSVVVGNAGLLPGGFPLLPDAQPDDGRLDVGSSRPRAWPTGPGSASAC